MSELRKIAIVGSAPSSRGLAPFTDASWVIWACSPSNVDLPRVDVWFELHDIDRMIADPNFFAFVRRLEKSQVYLQEKDDRFPRSETYPKDAIVDKYGPDFFSSTIAWMLALAIEQKPEEIGLFGIDMAAKVEYAVQRPGCRYFLRIAKEQGIKITVPPQSDLLSAPALYGYYEKSSMYQKLNVRRIELSNRLKDTRSQKEAILRDEAVLEGALGDVEYMLRTWIG